jgi:F-type H+-transporting ATPase subunit delta
VNEARIARSYAEALFALSKDAGQVQRARDDLLAAQRALESRPDAWPLLDYPEIPRREKAAAIDSLLPFAWEPVRRLILLLVLRQRRRMLPQMVSYFERAYEDWQGILPVEVTAAQQPDQPQVARLREILERKTGKQVRLQVRLDPGVLAGMMVKMRDRAIDGTAQGALERLRAHLAELELRSA